MKTTNSNPNIKTFRTQEITTGQALPTAAEMQGMAQRMERRNKTPKGYICLNTSVVESVEVVTKVTVEKIFVKA